ncbi:ABC transporter permease subunit [Nitratidesulfovibrio liaohensis]|uniref:ABC transporter permease subunit n=1 Tax=Nitratidesulfovibrio liaohensis TaxID=2604158 RepID=A0ABY9QZV4_9BACT|nr:ABC transporter permease subunit [Nitratidesulfovibrio liaohensis]WMW64729.1 ABC transporter permease subunit [Nitratidesulfovibrio liaohensis]
MTPRNGTGRADSRPHLRPDPQKGACLFLALLWLLFGLPLPVLALWAAAPGWAWPDLWPAALGGRTAAFVLAHGQAIVGALASSTLYSLAVVTVNLCACLAPARLLAFGRFPGRAALEGLLLAPALLPAMGFALGLYGTLVRLGLADTPAGVVLVLSVVSYPYMLRALASGFEAMGQDYGHCAANLGAGPLLRLLAVELPLLLPAAVAGGSVVFLVAFSDYFLVQLVGGGVVPSFTGYLFPVLQSPDRGLAAMLSLVFLVVPVTLFLLVEGLVLAVYRRRGM